MIQLKMSPALLGSRLTLGPAPWFRVDRNELRQGPTESLVGELRNHQWAVNGRHYAVVEATPGSTVRFASPTGGETRPTGPYREVRLADGALYADGKLVARFDDDTYLWRCIATHQAWPAVVVAAPGEVPRESA
jgi:hypothetical protein